MDNIRTRRSSRKKDNYMVILYLAQLAKQKRASILRNRVGPEVNQVAAIEIQRFWRGVRVRLKIKAVLEQLLDEVRSDTDLVAPTSASTSRKLPISQSKHPSSQSRSLPQHLSSRSHPQIKSHHPSSRSQPQSQSQHQSSRSHPQSQSPHSSSRSQPQSQSHHSSSRSHPPSESQSLLLNQSLSFVSPGEESLQEKKPQSTGKSLKPSLPKGKKVEWKLEKANKPEQQQCPLIVWPWSRHRRLQFAKRDSKGSILLSTGADRKRDLQEQADTSLGETGSLRGAHRAEDPGGKRLQIMTKKSTSRLALEASYDRYVQKALENGESSSSMLQFTEHCAYRIQIWWLMKHRRFLRKRFIQRLSVIQTKISLQSAAKMEGLIQDNHEENLQKKKRKGRPSENRAAISIQRAWRRHIDIQVYRYYRDLINFKTRGNPSVMLRCINPNEAKLLDPASGTSVRFRLAGDRFPPNIYYKIFTKRPVQDLCANSPKDYTKAQAKQLNVRHRHNNVATLPPQQDDKGGWYQRSENNGWRLVSDRLIHHIMNDPITWESSKKTYQFDHSKLKRKQDVEKHKKIKKIDWMKKMYKQGMLRARADDQETVQLIEGAAAGMMATVDNQGPDALEDWEVDELLDWTTSLNFDEYFSTWQDLATSATADNLLEKTMSIGTSKSDPYELTVSTAPSRFQSTRQSHHTTATLNSGSIHIKT